MMHFLLKYNRRNSALAVLAFEGPDARREALAARFHAESERRTADEEIVVLEASSLDEVMRTHQRYFRSAQEMTGTAASSFLVAS